MKGLHHPESVSLEGQSLNVSQPASCHTSSSDSVQEAWLPSSRLGPACWNPDARQASAYTRQSRSAHQLSVSAQQEDSADAARLRQSMDVMQGASPDSSPCSFSIHDDLHDEWTDEPYLPALDQKEVCRLQCLWRHHLQLADTWPAK